MIYPTIILLSILISPFVSSKPLALASRNQPCGAGVASCRARLCCSQVCLEIEIPFLSLTLIQLASGAGAGPAIGIAIWQKNANLRLESALGLLQLLRQLPSPLLRLQLPFPLLRPAHLFQLQLLPPLLIWTNLVE